MDDRGRAGQTVGGNTTSFSYSTDDELTSTSGNWVTSYSYNANGEQTSRTQNGVTYTQAFDYDGRMTSIYDGTNTNTFCYDATGRRFSRTSGGTTTKFLYGSGGIVLEKQGSTYTATYTIGNALVRKDGEYPMFDALGSERTICNSSQTVTGTAIYEGFGQVVATTGSSSNPYMFGGTSGYQNDGDGGLLHVGARYYDPLTGRFIARDDDLGEHPYLFCDHDPINWVDPTGHFPGDLGPIIRAGAELLGPIGMIAEVIDGIRHGLEAHEKLRKIRAKNPGIRVDDRRKSGHPDGGNNPNVDWDPHNAGDQTKGPGPIPQRGMSTEEGLRRMGIRPH